MNTVLEKLWNGEILPAEIGDTYDKDYTESELLLYGGIESFEDKLDSDLQSEFQTLKMRMGNFIRLSEKKSFCQGYSIGTCTTAESFITFNKITDVK